MTAKRRRERETPEIAAGARRFVRGLGKRVAQDDPNELRELLALQAEVEEALRVAVAGQRQAGFSWSEIADGLGTTKQAAFARFAQRVQSIGA